jgi:hypothetical protein
MPKIWIRACLGLSKQRRSRQDASSRKDLLDELGFFGSPLGYNVRTTCKVQTGTFTYRGSKKNTLAWPGGAGNNGQDETEQASPERRGRMEEIGFNLNSQSEKNERIWDAKLQRLKEYKASMVIA